MGDGGAMMLGDGGATAMGAICSLEMLFRLVGGALSSAVGHQRVSEASMRIGKTPMWKSVWLEMWNATAIAEPTRREREAKRDG